MNLIRPSGRVAKKTKNYGVTHGKRFAWLYNRIGPHECISMVSPFTKGARGDIFLNKDKFTSAAKYETVKKRKNVKGADQNKDIDGPLLEWFNNMRTYC